MENDYRKNDFDKWVQPGRWPTDLEFKDPSSMNLADSLKLYHHLRKRQDGAPKEEIFQISRVFAGAIPPTSTATRKVQVDYCGRKVWMMEFDEYVEYPPSTRPVAYGESSWKYFYFIKKQSSLDHWLQLPSVANNPVIDLMLPDSLHFVRKLLEPADSELCAKVIGFLDTVNQIEHHAPFTVRC
jgi:hypothetical protein